MHLVRTHKQLIHHIKGTKRASLASGSDGHERIEAVLRGDAAKLAAGRRMPTTAMESVGVLKLRACKARALAQARPCQALS